MALFLPVILVSLIVAALVVLALLAAFVSVVAVVLFLYLFVSVCCHFALVQHPPTNIL